MSDFLFVFLAENHRIIKLKRRISSLPGCERFGVDEEICRHLLIVALTGCARHPLVHAYLHAEQQTLKLHSIVGSWEREERNENGMAMRFHATCQTPHAYAQVTTCSSNVENATTSNTERLPAFVHMHSTKHSINTTDGHLGKNVKSRQPYITLHLFFFVLFFVFFSIVCQKI